MYGITVHHYDQYYFNNVLQNLILVFCKSGDIYIYKHRINLYIDVLLLPFKFVHEKGILHFFYRGSSSMLLLGLLCTNKVLLQGSYIGFHKRDEHRE